MSSERTGGRPTIGVLSPLAGGFYYGGILTGIAHTLAAAGVRMIVIQTLDAGYLNADFVDNPPFDSPLAWDHIAGFIAVVHAVGPEYLESVRRAGKPFVLVSQEMPNLPCPVVVPDNRGGIAESVRHLVAHGHTRIGFTGFLGHDDIRERHEAYRETLVACGIEPDPALTYATSDNNEVGGFGAAHEMIEAGLPSTAMVAATDLNAIGIMQGLQAAGYSLPRDQAITGFDDTDAATHVTPMLSTVKQDLGMIGGRAAELIMASVRGDAVPAGRRLVPTSFVARESCGCNAWQSAPGDGHTAHTRDEQGISQEFADAVTAALARYRTHTGDADVDAVSRTTECVSALITAAAAGGELPPIGKLRDAMTGLHHLAPSPETSTAIIAALRRLANRVSESTTPEPGAATTAAARIDDATISAIWTLAEAQTQDAYEHDRHVGTLLAAQYDVSMELLQGVDGDPRELRWLGRTHTRSGLLGIWTDNEKKTLELAGAYDRTGEQITDLTAILPVESFPPASMLAPEPEPDELMFAVPVKNATSDWGWLVTVGPIESASRTGRETANQWAALLTVALDQAAAGYELKGLERELRAILGNSPDAIARYDAHLRYEYLNAAARSALGVTNREIVGHTDQELGRAAAVAAVWEAGLRQVLVSGASTEVEFSEGDETDTRWYQAKMVPQFGPDGMVVGVLTSTRDLTAVKRAELALAHQAVHDSLTGLANRVLFVDRLTQAVTRLEREPGQLAVLFIDLDRFKGINDTLGHDAGDRLLVEIAERLVNVSRRVDTVGRFGGDEFVLLCDKLAHDEDVRIIAERVVRALSRPFSDGEHELSVSGSVGIVVTSNPYADVPSIIRNADAAMYQAKERGGNRFHVFDPDLRDRATARHLLEADLRHALERHELRLYYQPLFALNSGTITGVEALLRWEHPTRGLLLPEHFMSVAEQRGLIIPIGAWVVDEACRQLAMWDAEGLLPTISMAVNVSGRQLADPAIVGVVRDAIDRHGIRPARLTLEMTETTLIEDAANLRDTLAALAELGVHLALDDFGTGYSSLAHLRDFRVDILKIDRSFVEQLGDGGRAREIVGALTAMAHFLDMTVVGEGIETSKQWDELKDLDCDDGQGFLVSHPLQPGDLLALLQNQPVTPPRP